MKEIFLALPRRGENDSGPQTEALGDKNATMFVDVLEKNKIRAGVYLPGKGVHFVSIMGAFQVVDEPLIECFDSVKLF